MTTAASLAYRGYFPRELPPPFTTQELGRLFARRRPSNHAAPESRCVTHNLARPGGLRRPLSVPNPLAFILLAREIEAQWPALRAIYHGSHLSRSRPVSTTALTERAVIPRLRMNQLPYLRAWAWPGRRYILSTDINQFYASLYTHSLPWAMHTKRHAKAHRGRTAGDAIDRALRRAQQGQTIGVPIGPDTSLLMAELLLAKIDAEFQATRPPLAGFRYVDDYELAYKTLGDAEQALADLEGLLSGYELRLNPLKTGIAEVPQSFQEPWVSALHTFPVRSDSGRVVVNDTLALFSRAFELAAHHPGDGVLKYLLHRCRDIPIFSEGWRTFQGLAISTIVAEPTTFPVALDLLEQHSQRLALPVRQPALRELIEATIQRNAPLANGSEVAWALWGAIRWRIALGPAVSPALSGMEDDFVALLALDAQSRGLLASPLDLTMWAQLAGAPDALTDNHWLLAYEANRHGWIRDAAGTVAADAFFSRLEARRVHFYDATRLVPLFTGAAAPIPGGYLRRASV